MIEANVLLALEVIEALPSGDPLPFIAAGTQSQHCLGTPEYAPTDLYAATKEALEDIVAHYSDAKVLRPAFLKLSDTYGPGDTRSTLLNLLVDAMLSGQRIDLTQGDQKLDLIHVRDAADGFFHAARSMAFGRDLPRTCALRSRRQVTPRELLRIIEEIGDARIDARWGTLPYRRNTIMSPWRQRVLPGWKASIVLEEGVREVIADKRRIAA
jgi:nucleoside-diphosphate-sugar epimerase